MTPDKWQEFKAKISSVFKDAQIYREQLPETERGEKEIVEFDGPLGHLRLEYITRPVVLDKQVHGSRRIGSHHEVEYIYSETEFSRTLKAYKWDEAAGEWQEIDLKNSFNL